MTLSNMAYVGKLVLILYAIVLFHNVICEDSKNETISSKVEEEELIQSETKDGKLEIIKRIKKVNPDGSYTIGYEADDGSFKIESRDVLGNIKGTYGFVDDEGDIKRVSYSSSNSTDAFSKQEPLSTPDFHSQSVVQRIPKIDKAFVKNPYPTSTISTTTPTTTSALTLIQNIARRRQSSTTTTKPKSTSLVYTSAAPRVLLQRPSLATSTAKSRSNSDANKLERQIGRPEALTKPTEVPVLFRNSHSKNYEDEKPVTENTEETRNNVRRQLPQPDSGGFNAEEHVYGLQQSLGHNDVSDIYNNGVTISSRPLFTTTRPNRLVSVISSTTSSPVIVSKPTSKYAANYQRSHLQEVESNTQLYQANVIDEAATTNEPASTTTHVPVVQIPANKATPEPLVAIRHPFQQGAILVPLSQLQNRIIPVDSMQDIYNAKRNYDRNLIEVDRPIRLNPALRPLPVQVDENGFIREMPENVPTPYPVPVPVTPIPLRATEYEMSNEIDNIQPPVSTKDFQLLLNQLIMRQKRLEKISLLTNQKVRQDNYPVRYQRLVATPTPVPQQPYFIQKVVHRRPEIDQQQSARQYVTARPQDNEIASRFHYQYQQPENEEINEPKRPAASYHREQGYSINNRRAARLLPAKSVKLSPVGSYPQETQTEEYLPPDVRETLLLRMLQLAMNPALPLDEEQEEAQQVATAATPQFRRWPVRNVEVLGEEDEEEEEDGSVVRKRRPVSRTKRYKDEDMEYME